MKTTQEIEETDMYEYNILEGIEKIEKFLKEKEKLSANVL